MEEIAVVILAAGEGKRMKSELAKVLHPLCGKPMLFYVLELARELEPVKTVVVVGKQKAKVMDAFKDWDVVFAEQKELLGTGDAVMKAESALDGIEADILVMAGDTPLLRRDTIERMLQTHKEQHADVTLLSASVDKPTGYGRIVRGDGRVRKIVEEKDASEEEKNVHEINAGVYLFHKQKLFTCLKQLKPDNKQHEYYLTDVVRMIQEAGGTVLAIKADSEVETIGINDREALARVEEIIREQHYEGKEEKRN
jgi:bifunctional UDP-N-acetylglucosamine pyrophosphorylase/glucosamine-1-phosphate N-acetyltransferase